MRIIICTLMMLFCISCPAQEAIVTDSVNVLGYRLDIINSNNSCYLKYKIDSDEINLPLTPSPPCYFLRRNKILQSFKYPDQSVRAALIVLGSPITEEQRLVWNLAAEMICGNKKQGVLILKKDIVIPESTLSGGVTCRDKGSDEKDFWFFSHQKNVLK